MKLLELRKDTKIKHSVSSPPPKYWGDFFLKKALNGGTNFFGQIYGGMFYMKINDHIMQGGRKSFTNAFFNNLNTKSENFPQTWWKTHLKSNPYQSVRSELP